ncbi:MAG TPA: SMI1/KNR4 family protein [Mucilaginibacter sp.]|jgi:hypothetical protein|nr:SMI1/KNR4 family protein [Mucilaginibacter sp.]
MFPKKSDKPIYANLLASVDSPFFFEELKHISEQYWETVTLDKHYGYQIQPGSKWKSGLCDADLKNFEHAMGFTFPEPLANFYRAMNGLDRPSIDISGNNSEFRPEFYSFPNDLNFIKDQINWIYEANSIAREDMLNSGISRIFPIFAHRFMLIDIPESPILSMWGDDIIYWADDIRKLLIRDVFWNVLNLSDDKKLRQLHYDVEFWLD